MPHNTIDIRTEDGTCPTHIFTPAAAHNELPAVLLFMDGLGIRPAMFEIGQRLADGGYYVVLPDLYYRSGFTKGANLFRDDAIRAEWTKTVLPTVSIGNIMRDVPSLLAHLDAQPNVRSEQIGNGGEALADVVRAPRGKTEELGFSRRGRKREARTNADNYARRLTLTAPCAARLPGATSRDDHSLLRPRGASVHRSRRVCRSQRIRPGSLRSESDLPRKSQRKSRFGSCPR